MKQKSPNPFLRVAIAATALALAGSASAATITWGSATAISSSSDVSTNGVLVLARQANYVTSQTVNGVLFDGVNNTQNGVTLTLVDPAGSSFNYNGTYVVGATGTPGTMENAYQQMLTSGWYAGTSGGANSGAFSFSGLTVGQQYELQFWVADYRSEYGSLNRSETLTAGNTSGSLTFLRNDSNPSGSYILGTFTADNVAQSITLNSSDTVQLNALQLRAIPEPSAPLLGGLGMLALLRRRRSL